MPEVAPDRSGHVSLDGRDIWWERFGAGHREAVCLLNGLAMHTKAWYPFLDRLRPEFDVVLYDYPGQGASSAEDAPCLIPRLADALALVADGLEIPRLHVLGISYGGFVGLEFARLHPDRLHTLTLSGILLSHERLFEMYEALSLRFYRGGLDAFETYTHYMYEKIFGERFVRAAGGRLEEMRGKFFLRYRDRRHALVRLTEAQDPFFAALEENLPGYHAIRTPTLLMPGAEDRAIPPWVQRKIMDVLPETRWIEIPESGHVVYLEQPDLFFGNLKAFLRARSVRFEAAGTAVGARP